MPNHSAKLVELPMVTMDPRLTNFDCGMVSSELRPTGRDTSRNAFGTRSAAPPPPAPPAADGAIGEHQHIEFTFQVAGIERRRVDHLEGKLVLLEQPARPAGRHVAAILVVQADADGLELQRVARRRFRPRRRRVRRDPSRPARDGARGCRSRNPDGAGAQILAAGHALASSASRRRRRPSAAG